MNPLYTRQAQWFDQDKEHRKFPKWKLQQQKIMTIAWWIRIVWIY